ncbi:MAG: polymerase, sigma-24 subunit, subfamily [Chloroflexi bacterium]|nr:polymerase, sigma-24 subunit, subfamily [Chloroflexota bacterium]
MEALAHRLPYVDPDSDLVGATQVDPSNFVALYDRYFLRVHRYVRMRVRHTQTAEDVTSQVFLMALARIGNFRAEGCFAAWLFRIAQNAVQDTHRARRSESAGVEALDTRPDEGPGPEAQALAGEHAAALQALISTLRPEQQDLLALRFGADLSAVEIGGLFGKSAEAVRVSLHRTIKELRQRYSDER